MAKPMSELTKAMRVLFGKNLEITYREALPILRREGFKLVKPPSRKAIKQAKAEGKDWEETPVGQRYRRFKAEENSFNVNKYIFKNLPETAPVSAKPMKKRRKVAAVAASEGQPRKLRKAVTVPTVEVTFEEALTYAKDHGGVGELAKSVATAKAKVETLQKEIETLLASVAKEQAVIAKVNEVKADIKSAA